MPSRSWRPEPSGLNNGGGVSNQCKYCGAAIAWVRRRALNLDGVPHSKTCPRLYAFRPSALHCLGCDVNLSRGAHEHQGVYPADDDYRVIFCPSCCWSYSWHVSINGVGFAEVETAIAKMDSETRWRLHHHEIEIVDPNHYRQFLASQPQEQAIPF